MRNNVIANATDMAQMYGGIGSGLFRMAQQTLLNVRSGEAIFCLGLIALDQIKAMETASDVFSGIYGAAGLLACAAATGLCGRTAAIMSEFVAENYVNPYKLVALQL